MSIRRIISSQQNGSLSHGPKTPEGIRRCQTAPVRHGLLAQTLTALDNEDHQEFVTILQQYNDELQTTTNIEAAIVDQIAAAIWRLRRTWKIEAHIMKQGLDLQAEDRGSDAATTGSYQSAAKTSDYKLLLRYEAQLHRLFHRSLNSLLHLQKSIPLEKSPVSESNPFSDSVADANVNTLKVQTAA